MPTYTHQAFREEIKRKIKPQMAILTEFKEAIELLRTQKEYPKSITVYTDDIVSYLQNKENSEYLKLTARGTSQEVFNQRNIYWHLTSQWLIDQYAPVVKSFNTIMGNSFDLSETKSSILQDYPKTGMLNTVANECIMLYNNDIVVPISFISGIIQKNENETPRLVLSLNLNKDSSNDTINLYNFDYNCETIGGMYDSYFKVNKCFNRYKQENIKLWFNRYFRLIAHALALQKCAINQ